MDNVSNCVDAQLLLLVVLDLVVLLVVVVVVGHLLAHPHVVLLLHLLLLLHRHLLPLGRGPEENWFSERMLTNPTDHGTKQQST